MKGHSVSPSIVPLPPPQQPAGWSEGLCDPLKRAVIRDLSPGHKADLTPLPHFWKLHDAKQAAGNESENPDTLQSLCSSRPKSSFSVYKASAPPLHVKLLTSLLERIKEPLEPGEQKWKFTLKLAPKIQIWKFLFSTENRQPSLNSRGMP